MKSVASMPVTAVSDGVGPPDRPVPQAALRQSDTESLTTEIKSVASELRRLRQIFENRIIESPYLGIEGAAHYLCLSVDSVEYYAKRRRQLPYHVVGRKLVFHRDDLNAFMKRNRRPGVDG